MKKILSLVLAVAMLSTMAFAADMTGATSVVGENPGEKLVVDFTAFKGKVIVKAAVGKEPAEVDTGYLSLASGDFCNDNFSISKKSFSKGAALVKSVTIDDENEEIKIALNTDYTLSRPGENKAANFVIKDLSVKAKKAVGNAIKNQVYELDTTKAENTAKIGYVLDETNQVLNGTGVNYDDSGDTMIKFKEGSQSYDIASTNNNTDAIIEGRVYAGDKVYLKIDNAVGDDQKAVLKNNENADLRFVNVTTNGLPSNNDIQLLAEKDEFVYEIVDGKVTASKLKWSDDDYAWVGKIRSNKQYVISDIQITASAGSAGSENPDTGANDVVGVAAALAIVSVVAAAAVSLKK